MWVDEAAVSPTKRRRVLGNYALIDFENAGWEELALIGNDLGFSSSPLVSPLGHVMVIDLTESDDDEEDIGEDFAVVISGMAALMNLILKKGKLKKGRKYKNMLQEPHDEEADEENGDDDDDAPPVPLMLENAFDLVE